MFKVGMKHCKMYISILHQKGKKFYCLFITGIDLNKEESKITTGCNLRYERFAVTILVSGKAIIVCFMMMWL